MLIALATASLLMVVLIILVSRRRMAPKSATDTIQVPDIYAVGIEHYKAGRMEEAEPAFRETIRIKPDFAEAYFKLGNVMSGLGRLDEAESMLKRAVEIQPDFHQAYNNLGNLLRFTGRTGEAEAAFRNAVASKPDFPEALNNLGILLVEEGRAKEAETAFREALKANPASFDVLFNLATLLDDTGQQEEAEETYRQVLRLNHDFHPATTALGVLLFKNSRQQEAVTYFQNALRISPEAPENCSNLGLALQKNGRLGEAETYFRRAIALQPDNIDNLYNLADLLVESRDFEEAEAIYQQIIKTKPNDILALNKLANLLRRTHSVSEAEIMYRKALDIPVQQAETIYNLGGLFILTGRHQEAEEAYQQVLKLDPSLTGVKYDLAMLRLLQGDFEHAWEAMEYRFQTVQKHEDRGFSKPRWDGKEFWGETLLVHREQGEGDCIHFFRYLPRLATMGQHLVVECSPALFRLFRENLPVDVELVKFTEALPDFDKYCPLMSLPMYFQTSSRTIPNQVPYLTTPVEAIANCAVLPALENAPVKVGLVRAGSPTHSNDYTRSLDFNLLNPLFEIPGITWVNLQAGRCSEDFDRLVDQSCWMNPMKDVKDYADTAAIINQLDLIIGVDTSVIHLAGALGKPVWGLLPIAPDWRWQLNREDCPWYPTMRLFRQTAYNDWPEVIQRVADALPNECEALLNDKHG